MVRSKIKAFSLFTLSVAMVTILFEYRYYNFKSTSVQSFKKKWHQSRAVIQSRTPIISKIANFHNISKRKADNTNLKQDQTEKFLMLLSHGRLGNQLFMYASAYGIAKRTNRTLIACQHELTTNGERWVGWPFPLDLFPYIKYPPIELKECDKIYNKTKNVTNSLELPFRKYDMGTINKMRESKAPLIAIKGYLQNIRYFQEYEQDLRNQLKFSDEYVKFGEEFLQTIKANISHYALKRKNILFHDLNFISIQVRRGDALVRRKNMNFPTQKYFDKAMNLFKNRYGHSAVFIVLTLDVMWSKEHIKGERVYFTSDFGVKSAVEDLAIGVACNHSIISVGSYGWWMAYLQNKGDVICNRNERVSRDFKPHERFPPTWKCMDLEEAEYTGKGHDNYTVLLTKTPWKLRRSI